MNIVWMRFRRSTGVERQQLKWFTFAAIVDVLLIVAWVALVLDPLTGALSALLLAALPIAIGIAILRYHLYDIDRIVSRTIGYAIVTGILGVTFVTTVLIAQTVVDSLVPQLTETGTLAVAASTLAAAALFQPSADGSSRSWTGASIGPESTGTDRSYGLPIDCGTPSNWTPSART